MCHYWLVKKAIVNLPIRQKKGNLKHYLTSNPLSLMGPRPQLFKRWITLSTGENTTHWIVQLVSLTLIGCIVIYPMGSAIHLLNNWGRNNYLGAASDVGNRVKLQSSGTQLV